MYTTQYMLCPLFYDADQGLGEASKSLRDFYRQRSDRRYDPFNTGPYALES